MLLNEIYFPMLNFWKSKVEKFERSKISGKCPNFNSIF